MNAITSPLISSSLVKRLLSPREQVDAVAFSSRSQHISRSELEPAVTTTEPPDQLDAITFSPVYATSLWSASLFS
jgi:hypothetical protein